MLWAFLDYKGYTIINCFLLLLTFEKGTFLNQVRAWFLKIDPVRIVGMRVRVCVCVYVSAPEAINN